jgi:mono/diheme cytochrome c family protein
MKTACLLTLLGASVLCAKNWREFAGADPRTAAVANPYEGQEEAVMAGEKLYKRYCASCHGARAEGEGQAPPLTGAAVGSLPPGTLYWLLRNGSLARGMPSWSHLPPEQRWQIVSFLKTYMK